MAVNLSMLAGAGAQFFDNNGVPLAGGKLYTYQAATTTPQPSYTTSAGNIAHTNPIILNAAGRVANSGEIWLTDSVNYKFVLTTANDVLIATYDNISGNGSGILASLTAPSGASLVGFQQPQTGAVSQTVNSKLRQYLSVLDSIPSGTDTSAVDCSDYIQAAVDSLADGGALYFPSVTSYRIDKGIEIFDKGRCQIDFNGQVIDASNMPSGTALNFRGISQSRVGGIFVVGNNNITGVEFGATATSITIHAQIGKIHASGCNIGVFVGNNQGYQFSDTVFEDIYGADCNIGVYLTGENTLAMYYQRVAAYNNTSYGVLIEQGGGAIGSLQVAASDNDIFFGQTNGANHNKLNRWDIVSGYSEEGVNGEIFINSAACSDTNPFREQIVMRGFRCTPFSSTNVENFVRWNLNGDLIFENCTFTHGTQLPWFVIDGNSAYRAARILIQDSVIDCAPKSGVQVPLLYKVTSIKNRVEMDCVADNAMTFWQNNGNANEGLMKYGIFTDKTQQFEQALRSIANFYSGWNLRNITSGTVENSVLPQPSLTVSATVQRRDVWADDGLFGFFRNATTSKTVSVSSSAFAVGEYTFGMFLRATGPSTDETDYNALGGATGMRLGVGDTGGAFVRCIVGNYNAQATPTNPLDPHLVIGRFIPSSNVKVDAINLRTGEIVSAVTGSGPALIDLTWSNGFSFRNDLCVRGFPFLYNRSLSDAEVRQILQSAMLLTDSWRQ